MKLTLSQEIWPVAGVFRISRGAVTSVEVLVVEVEQDGLVGRGEACPFRISGETIERSRTELEDLRRRVEGGLDRDQLQELLGAGAARNALDCALWDLQSKREDVPAWRLAGLDGLREIVTAYTISLDEPALMAEQARGVADRPLLKVKLGREGSVARVRAVREAAPQSRIIVDANEAWTVDILEDAAERLDALGVELIEQPLPAGEDAALDSLRLSLPVAADESCLDRGSLDAVEGRYQFINIKLDKTGGLTEALALAEDAQSRGLRLMVGCMLGTSLAMAPASLIGQNCEFVDLDGPLLLAEDRLPCLRYDRGVLSPPPRELWG